MTFILGVNLSDRIFLAADSRVTKLVNNKRELVGHSLKLVQMSNKDHDGFISCLFAGNKSFINYIFKRFEDALDNKFIDTDINILLKQVDNFMKKIVPEYPGPIRDRRCKIIFAGCSNAPRSVKRFRTDNLSAALGPEAGRLDDPRSVQGIQTGFVFVPDQKIFSYVIDVANNQFGIEEVGEMYSLICGGSKKLTPQEKQLILKHFLSKRNLEDEGKDIINFLRKQFSDSIGGAVTFGFIDSKKYLIYVGYDIDRSEKMSQVDWSFTIKNDKFIARDPEGKEHDLVWGFYNLTTDHSDNNLEL
jgi:hypothetical protein